MKYPILLLLCLICSAASVTLSAQSEEQPQVTKVFQTFKDTRVINTPSVEMVPRGSLDFRVGHRFGDAGGAGGGWTTLYGLEEAEDVMIGFDYGLGHNWTIGIMRAKGSGPLRQNVSATTKLRIIEQEVNGNQPVSLVVYGMASVSTMPKSAREDDLNFFAEPEHRLTYHMQLLLARKFSSRFSLQLGGGWTYRNIVPFNDLNDLVHASASARIQVTKAIGLILDATVPFGNLRNSVNDDGEREYFPALGIGIEWETGGGHVFQMNFTNATGIAETDYIPYTQSDWREGQFRLGFTISRLFKI